VVSILEKGGFEELKHSQRYREDRCLEEAAQHNSAIKSARRHLFLFLELTFVLLAVILM